MTTTQSPQFPLRNVSQLVEDIATLTKEIQELYCQDDIPWIVGVSWGKDSTTVLQLIWNAIAALPLEKRHKTIHVITTDTLVENPIVSVWVRKSIKKLQNAAIQQQMPVKPHLLHPSLKESFWVCLIGKGYPAPRNGFRWCTDRLKIQPVNYFIRDMVRAHGETIVVLGIRKAESATRAATMKKHEEDRLRDRLSPNGRLINSLVYTPIEDWRTDEVWLYLMQWENPWGHSNKELFAMYRGATADNECPLVVDTSTPSCGDSRFGCWVCTMVSKDKSMEAMIQNDEEKEWLQPLLDIRNELDVQDDKDKRDFRRIYGRVELFGKEEIEPIPGPYTKYWREHWLRRVLQAQVEVRKNAPEDMKDITLITMDELSEIRQIWLDQKHEFDDSLPKIYEEVTGEPFKDPRRELERRLLGEDEWNVLAEICGDDVMHLELMTKLLDTERQHYTKTRRSNIYNELQKCFETSSRSREDAIDNAHLKRHLKTAAAQGDVESIKQQLTNPEKENGDLKIIKEKIKENLKTPANNQQQLSLSWGNLKFSNQPTEPEEE
ncbi:DNA phosphorothioation system sulfurtransferase DndC [Gloeothece verrucosa]|uniref:Sulfurtransferase DndC n=1 Tax=Gloeothece verrucosa (strain PCC 7822) TaxID=497965 RepID=E0UFG3_GLOV7|nr:DNA phosphorothioation system sulfurtransferase DndC [Gloeothece verrucosa]ADN16657.1 sulfurtransferase DndC [Gloeothece verrucosa PCC 7822]